MKVGIISLGCAKNLVDTENLLGLLAENDIELVTSYDDADAIIINTCGFIESAKKESIDTILRIADLKEKNLKKLIVMGCLSQRYKKDLILTLPEVDLFIAIDEYDNLGLILSDVLGVKITNTYGKTPRKLSGKEWMAYLRIADGCDNKCSYCAIPSIRGPLKSRSEEKIIEEAKELIQQGVKEINLVAQDASRYGYDMDHTLHLSSLLKKLDVLEGINWIRILYLYPDEIPDDLIETMKNGKHILPYFDIPVQHGSDRILKEMNRRGSHALIVERVQKIREALPDAFLRTTLITGFPSETEEDHQETLRMIKEVEWDHLGAFTYSKEEDTPAYSMEDDVPEDIKNQRLQEILALQASIESKRYSKWIGKEDIVLVEGIDALTGMYIARSAMFAPDDVDGSVRFSSLQTIDLGTFVKVKYKKVSNQTLIADVVEENA